MRTVWRAGRWIAVVVVASVFLVGCGNDTGETGPAETGNGDDGGVPDAPFNEDDDKQAPSSPLDIPPITERQGDPVDEIRRFLEESLTEQCGGVLCVTIQHAPDAGSDVSMCTFLRVIPPPGGQVERGGVVVLVTGPEPCPTPTAAPSPTWAPSPTAEPGATESGPTGEPPEPEPTPAGSP